MKKTAMRTTRMKINQRNDEMDANGTFISFLRFSLS